MQGVGLSVPKRVDNCHIILFIETLPLRFSKFNKMKNNQSLKTWLRVLLGLFLIVYALNQFLRFLPTSYGKMPEDAMNFIYAVAIYLPILFIFEIILGLLFILNKWTPFLLLALFPLSVAFLIFSISNQDFLDAIPALVVATLNFILVAFEKERYRPLFKS